VQNFVNDDHPGAWERLVDRLLASPLYGQRWGRHWLDIARYATTKGYVFQENPIYPFAHTYRDYVVDAFNNDKPYDRFLLEQIAADQLDLEENDPALAALGFLTVGPRYLNREPDIIDDRIDVVTRGTLGMTLACARCHDHKYDPLPTADYYALYGVFASSEEPDKLPLIGEIEETPGYLAFKAEQDKRRAELENYVNHARQELLTQARERVGDYLLGVAKAEGKLAAAPEFEHGAPRDKLVRRWTDLIKRRIKEKDPVFLPWGAFAELPAEGFAERARELLDGYRPEQEQKSIVNQRVWQALEAKTPASFAEFTSLYAKLLRDVDAEWTALRERNPQAERLPDDAAEQLRRVLYGPDSITDVPPGRESEIFERDNRDQINRLERKIDEWLVESPNAPPRAMVLVDRDQPREPVIFERGNPSRRGDRVPRRTPLILTGGESKPYQQGSGRLELARAIASPENPLTARVFVNRVWNWHFGRGFVESQSDFGQRSDPPSHPELLDWLAWTFMHTDGWSVKRLHRRIMLSETYQQASAVERPECAKVDPENRLYWRMNRQRLEFEPMRDALLAAAGQLDPAMGGRPVDIENPKTTRRTVYARIDRNNFSPLLRTFDYPSPDATSPGRPLTTVPQQALYAMNSDFLRETAGAVDRRAKEAAGDDADASGRIESLYRVALSRDPTPNERKLALQFVEKHPDRWLLLAQTLLLTNEFLFVD
jgi:hypothetical protein